MAKQKLLDQVRAAIRVRHMSYRTEQTYVDWIRRFILFHNKRHPNEMDETHMNDGGVRNKCWSFGYVCCF